MSRLSCRCLIGLRVEDDESHRGPVAGLLGPALGVGSTRPLVEHVPLLKHVGLPALVPLVRGDVANRAVAMLAVVPGNKSHDPLVRGADIREWHAWIRWRVLERSK